MEIVYAGSKRVCVQPIKSHSLHRHAANQTPFTVSQPIKCHSLHRSQVAHATSRSPGRDYTFESVVLPPRGTQFFDGSTTHNPTVVQLPNDGGYALYYIGLNCGNYSKQPSKVRG